MKKLILAIAAFALVIGVGFAGEGQQNEKSAEPLITSTTDPGNGGGGR